MAYSYFEHEYTAPNLWQRMIAPDRRIDDAAGYGKTKLINAAILITCAILALSMIVIVARAGWAGMTFNMQFIALGLALLFFNPKRYTLKGMAVCVWIGAYVVIASLDGFASRLETALLITPALLFVMFEPRHWPILALVTFGVGLFYVWQAVYWPTARYYDMTFWQAIQSPAVYDRPLRPVHIQFIFNTFATLFALFAMCYGAFAMLARAESKLRQEYDRSETLLRAILPMRVADRLKQDPRATVAEDIQDATILFADLVGFTRFAATHSAEETVSFLNALFSLFDEMVDSAGLEKVKTIGDGYVAAGGLDGKTDHAARMAALALAMMDGSQALLEEAGLSLRIGLNRGPVTAGVIGQHKPFFDVWGDTVNVASRLEAKSAPGRIQMSGAFKDALPDDYTALSPRQVPVAGKGEIIAYWLQRGDGIG